MEIIRTENLTKRYGKVVAIDNLNFTVNEGECMGLLGPNGAGKTTTIKILTGLLKPTKGKAYIMDIDVTKAPEKALKNIGAMIETPELYPELTPRQIMMYIGRLRGYPNNILRKNIREALEKVKMIEWIDTPTGKFSRGMKQRIALATAIFTDPEIIILDEPSLGLDPRGMVEIREIIKDLNKEGRTILMASHLLNEVQQVCTSVTLISKGKILLKEEIANLENAIKSLIFEVKLLESINNTLLDKVRNLPNVSTVKVKDDNSFVLGVEGGLEAAEKILRMLIVDLNLKVVEYKLASSLLESIYMDLVKEVS